MSSEIEQEIIEGEEDVKDQDEENGENDEDENEELAEDIEALKKEMAKIVVEAPTIDVDNSETYDLENFSKSYKEISPKEKLILSFAENFRRQYVHLYRDRKPLFLNPLNECGVEKFVCTTIRPIQLPYQSLYDWDGCGEFVADYLNFVPLEPPTDLPKRLKSPTTVLDEQKGNCFEYSTLLCSFLIGAGYDAYVVNGYATRETCLMDETREICPLMRKKEEKTSSQETKQQRKYAVRPPKDLRSKYEMKQHKRKEDEEATEAEKRRQEEDNRIAELEKPPKDPLFGLRIHSWVLVLANKREVPESFFIEPFTGIAHPVNSVNYLGIESVWNHHNYWVNMQDCSEGVKRLKYDLGDPTLWEYMYPSNEKPQLQIPDDIMNEFDDDDEEEEEIEKHLDMPPSWVDPIRVEEKDFQLRCPQGKKTLLYKKAKLDKYAPYLHRDGLVSRLSVYDDYELNDLLQVKEYYENRIDKLYCRVHNHQNGWVTEQFYEGRQRNLKEHRYKANAPVHETDRVMVFYSQARVDGLLERREKMIDKSTQEMTEQFVDRTDFLYFRSVTFGKRPKKFGPADGKSNPKRPIHKMVEKFKRNEALPANEDMAEVVYNIQEEKITVTYHTENSKISASTREFIKPPNSDEKGATLIMSPEMHTTFQVEPQSKQKKQVEVYEQMVELIASEDASDQKARESEDEVEEILNDRTKEEATSELDISVYDTSRNEKAKKHRKELERLAEEEKMRRQEMELDYLAPFLAQIGDPEQISRQQAYKLKEDCLADLKQRLIDKANLIQARFEKETQELQKKQQWYQQNQVSMQKDDEAEYLAYCGEAMFRIHILELRLNRHKEMAPHKYMALESKIRTDPRLSEYF
ncbi:unnamed protein product [Owenia fusiformis]|uniref:Dynein regulatory complex subunit 7 n=1 Tax=Owenia fusiformis TaxID=6347 RepID=A0A8J1U6X0_OWEFU|nr:unnamed protein product [Owenia fusiformis]